MWYSVFSVGDIKVLYIVPICVPIKWERRPFFFKNIICIYIIHQEDFHLCSGMLFFIYAVIYMVNSMNYSGGRSKNSLFKKINTIGFCIIKIAVDDPKHKNLF